MKDLIRFIFFVLLGALCGEHAFAKDYFLTIGGGYNPTGNQVSLEKNVIFMQSVLAEQRPDHPPHDIFFADGDDAERDVHYRDPDFEKTCPPARRSFAPPARSGSARASPSATATRPW